MGKTLKKVGPGRILEMKVWHRASSESRIHGVAGRCSFSFGGFRLGLCFRVNTSATAVDRFLSTLGISPTPKLMGNAVFPETRPERKRKETHGKRYHPDLKGNAIHLCAQGGELETEVFVASMRL